MGNHREQLSHSARPIQRRAFTRSGRCKGAPLDGCRRSFECIGKAEPILCTVLTGSQCPDCTSYRKKKKKKNTTQTPLPQNFQYQGKKKELIFRFVSLPFSLTEWDVEFARMFYFPALFHRNKGNKLRMINGNTAFLKTKAFCLFVCGCFKVGSHGVSIYLHSVLLDCSIRLQ